MSISLGLSLKAATFVVNTNADSGSGSLRDAILQANANGVADKDFIHFNILAVGANDVNILLQTELPELTSNIVIDGTTQPTAFLNSPTIKIRLSHASPTFINGIIIKGVDHIEIYGIDFIGFKTGLSTPANGAIFLNNASDVIIGAPTKGNSFGANYAGVFSPSGTQLNQRTKIQSNYFGFAPNGTTLNPNSNGIDISFCKELLVGGTATEGNFFGGNTTSGISIGAAQGITHIQNNWVGLDITGKFIPTTTATGIYANGLNGTMTIEDNVVVGQKKGLVVNDVGTGFSIKRNRLGTGFLGTENWGNLEIGLEIYQGNAGTVGGATNADKNYIAYNRDAIYITRAYPVTITKNSVYCNTGLAIKLASLSANDQAKIAIPNVLSILPTAVKGTYNPGSIVELFEDDSCPGCSGKTWIATLISDVSGNWSYNGPVNGPITVTGTNSEGATSPFSSPVLDESTVLVKEEYCGTANGSITQLKVFNADEFRWYDDKGVVVGTEKDLINVKAGYYYLVARQQGNCSITSSTFRVKPIDVTYKLTKYTKNSATCGKANGSIIIETFELGIPISFIWLNENGDVISTDRNVNGLVKGTYRFYGENGYGCKNLIETFIIDEKTDLEINTSKLAIYNSSCLKDEGSIFGLTIKGGTAPYTYEWFDVNNQKVGDGLNLMNMPSAKYQLKVTDKNGCDVQSAVFTIPPSPLNVKLPDSFSPNGDGINDVWRVPGIGSFRNTEVRIFNRYGAIVFLSRNNEKEFDGRQNGKDLPIGMYYYIITLNNNCSDIIGNIVLIR